MPETSPDHVLFNKLLRKAWEYMRSPEEDGEDEEKKGSSVGTQLSDMSELMAQIRDANKPVPTPTKRMPSDAKMLFQMDSIKNSVKLYSMVMKLDPEVLHIMEMAASKELGADSLKRRYTGTTKQVGLMRRAPPQVAIALQLLRHAFKKMNATA